MRTAVPYSPELTQPEEASTLPETFIKYGHATLEQEIEIEPLRAPLPEGYRYEDPAKIDPSEVVGLFRQVEIGKDLPDDFMKERAEIVKEMDANLIDVGVRSSDGTLVGFGGVSYRDAEGELSDFVTSPNHQGKGIGKAVIDERLRLAEEAGITKLVIPNLEPTNTLKSYYLEKGFAETVYGDLERNTAVPAQNTEQVLVDA